MILVTGVYHCPADRSTVEKTSLLRFRSYGLEGNLARKESEIINPADNFGFLDVSAGSIGAGAFGIAYDEGTWLNGPARWVHRPSERHDKGANLSFLDGHVQGHTWRNPVREREPVEYVLPRNPADWEDLLWLANRTHIGQYRSLVHAGR